jgi:hypothetical protein
VELRRIVNENKSKSVSLAESQEALKTTKFKIFTQKPTIFDNRGKRFEIPNATNSVGEMLMPCICSELALDKRFSLCLEKLASPLVAVMLTDGGILLFIFILFLIF